MPESEKESFSWDFEAGFLRSPVNPRMLLLNRTPEIDCADDGNATGNASAWSLISIANDLLRVDLSSFFNEIGDRFYKQAYQHPYIELQSIAHQDSAFPCRVPNTSPDWATEPDNDDRFDPNDPDQESAHEELSKAEIADLLQRQKEHDLNFFASIFDKAITRHVHGEISDETRLLLRDVCKRCVMYFTEIPDYRYYDCWINNNAIECDEINHLYRAVITTSDQLNSQEMAALFSSYLKLESNSVRINAENGSTHINETGAIRPQ